MDNWDDLKFVLALSRHGTMTAAAQALGTNVATVSRRIDRITERSATPLFVKVNGQWQATPTALGFIRAAEEFDAKVRSEENNARDAAGQTDQQVRITAMPFVHHSVLIPGLATLRKARPNIRVCLRNRAESLGLGDTDIVLRFGRPDAGRLVARKVADLRFHAFCRARQTPRPGWIGVAEEFDDRPSNRLGVELFGSEPSMRCDIFEHVLEATKATGMAGIIPDVLGRQDPALDLVPGCRQGIEVEIWMAFHQSRREDVALRGVADWIVGAFADTAWANIEDEVEIAAE